ncbi:hypothetical protein MJN76_31825, partial [Salmonella enterica subsp. enterica serovar Anatum]|nr:hypothetical protein [Salmonella enterica subsp. enterica serovar Anatum]
QLRISETEKYAHVTFFFNGGVEEPFAGEERILINSPKVATYDRPFAMVNNMTDLTAQDAAWSTRDHLDDPVIGELRNRFGPDAFT